MGECFGSRVPQGLGAALRGPDRRWKSTGWYHALMKPLCHGLLYFTLLMSAAVPSSVDAQGEPPAAAAAAGYRQNTFSTFKSSDIDLNDTGKSGFAWYVYHFFGAHPRSGNIQTNDDGSVTLNGDVTGPNGELATAAPAKNAAKFVGLAFGGGAYVEAAIRFDPVASRANPNGWPSFWSLSLEHAITDDDQWNGLAAGYKRFIEVDIFEYDINGRNLGLNYYGANLHDWYGVYNRTCPGHGFCDSWRGYSDVKTMVSPDVDFTQYHRYGFLWTPATGSVPGTAVFFFDGNQVGKKVTWVSGSDGSATPEGQPWKFGIIDTQHLVLILGTGVGKPMTVGSVNVWQSSDRQNLHN